ncbi:MAG: uroporphyrinogen-III synthase [Pseudomonadota bacterium]
MRTSFEDPIEICIAPLLRIAATQNSYDLTDVSAVVFTSENGVRFAPNGEGLLAFCVGDRTAAAAKTKGYKARSAGGAVQDLLQMLFDELPDLRTEDPITGDVLHIRGQDTVGDVSHQLRSAGIPARDAVVYQQVAQAFQDEHAVWLKAHTHVIAPVFSPKSASALLKALEMLPESALGRIDLVAMSAAVGDVLEKSGYQPEIVAQPTGAAMLKGVTDRLRACSA